MYTLLFSPVASWSPLALSDVTPKALLALLALGAIWGASFLFIKVIVDETSALEVAEGRMFFGALAVGVVIAMRKCPFAVRPSSGSR